MKRIPPAATALLALSLVAVAAGAPAAVAAADTASDSTANIVARYPSDGEMVEETVVSPSDVASVEAPDDSGRGWSFEVTLTDEAAAAFANTLVESGFTDEGVNSCPPSEGRNDEGYCLLTVVDGEAVSALGVAPGFADAVESGEFEDDPRFLVQATNESTAERAARAFGAEIGNDTSTPTTTESTAEATTEPENGDATDGAAPGFGVVAAAAAVAAGALAAARSD